MTFYPNIPEGGQTLGQTQPQVLSNFTNYKNLISVDHVDPNLTGQGQHKQVTLNTFLAPTSAPAMPIFPPVANQSWLFSADASASGTQCVYQPSVASIFVPVSPRSLGRIVQTGAGVFALVTGHEGPYGANTSFNVLTPTGTLPGVFIYNFANPLSSNDYFINFTIENVTTNGSYSITSKTVNGFTFNGVLPIGVAYITIMVY